MNYRIIEAQSWIKGPQGYLGSWNWLYYEDQYGHMDEYRFVPVFSVHGRANIIPGNILYDSRAEALNHAKELLITYLLEHDFNFYLWYNHGND